MKALSNVSPAGQLRYRSNVGIRLPLTGFLDLTYRCNNHCIHCWLEVADPEAVWPDELSTREWIEFIDQARAMGAREWHLSGGEPMLRPDFAEIFEHLTRKALRFSLNTNGTLITPAIARLLKGKKGAIMVALYGATAAVHDHITGQNGSWEAMRRGCAYLREAQVDFIVQVVSMRDNHHQHQDLVKLAMTLSPAWRIGVDVLHLSASGTEARNCQIQQQRLAPFEVMQLTSPHLLDEGVEDLPIGRSCGLSTPGQHPLAACILDRDEFHIDPYGQLSFCPMIKDPALRYDLRRGSFAEGWEVFLPSLVKNVEVVESAESCGLCELKKFCTWCPAFAYLETKTYSAKIDYLCRVAAEKKAYLDTWTKNHRRFYQVAGITIQLTSELAITDSTFLPVFRQFETASPGQDVIVINHHFHIPEVNPEDLGKSMYQGQPWSVYQKNGSWFFLSRSPRGDQEGELNTVAVFNQDWSRARFYNNCHVPFNVYPMSSLTLCATDQIFLALFLANRQACLLHSSGVVFKGHGWLFVGHSEAGKSTVCKLFGDRAEVLCDDRNVVRKWPEGYRIHGTWSHGEIPVVSSASAPLLGIFFLEKSTVNEWVPLVDKSVIRKKLLACLIRSFPLARWWEKALVLIEQIAAEVPCYQLKFDKSGKIVNCLESLTENSAH